MTEIKPGESVSIRYFAHRHFDNMSAGEFHFGLRWDLDLTEGGEKKATLMTAISLTVEPVTERAPERVLSILADQSRRSKPDALIQIPRPEDYLIGTENSRFAELAISLLGSGRLSSSGQSRLAVDVVSRAVKDQALRPLIRGHLISQHPGGAPDLISALAGEHAWLTDAEWKDLYDRAGNSLVRVLTRRARKTRLTDQELATLCQQLTMLAAPAPAETVTRLVRDLDSENFQVRETATRKLMELGESAKGQLKATDATTLSAEAQKRLRAIISDLEHRKPDLLLQAAVRSLERERSSESIHLLRALLKCPSESSPAVEAAAALHRLGLK